MSDTHKDWPSVNKLAAPLVENLIEDANQLGLSVNLRGNGCTVVDAGIFSPGSYEAGCRIARICMADLGQVEFTSESSILSPYPEVTVNTAHPVLCCLGSQYAGWSLEYKNDKTFRALGSGPARALATVESLYEHLGYHDEFDRACMVIETSKFPPDGLMDRIAADCGIDTGNLTLILTPTGSAAGVTQIASRVVEVALHKAHTLEFEIDSIQRATGAAVVAPPTSDSLVAMGRTNDSILYGGHVTIDVDCSRDDAQSLASDLPSCNSSDYGIPFARTFKNYDYDFYQIDPMLFSPARVSVRHVGSGNSFHAGGINLELLEQSFSADS